MTQSARPGIEITKDRQPRRSADLAGIQQARFVAKRYGGLKCVPKVREVIWPEASFCWENRRVSDTARQDVIAALEQLQDEWAAGPPDRWENWTIPEYLGAMAAWLKSYEHAFVNSGQPVPTDGWAVFAHAVRAAAIYE